MANDLHIDVSSLWEAAVTPPKGKIEKEDLLKSRESLKHLIHDVYFVIQKLDEFDDTRNLIFCVDFEMLLHASRWLGPGRRAGHNELPFWSSMLLYLDTARHAVLPGTLFEALGYFSRSISLENTLHLRGQSQAFYNSIASGKFRNTSFETKNLDATIEFKNEKYFKEQLFFIFATLQERCQILDSSYLGHPKIEKYDTCMDVLAHVRGHDGVRLNNRADAINYSCFSNYNKNISKDESLILVTNTNSLFALCDTLSGPFKSRSSEWSNEVWRARSAVFYQLLMALVGDRQDAKSAAWELLRDLHDRRRFLESLIDKVDTVVEEDIVTERYSADSFSYLLTSFSRFNTALVEHAERTGEAVLAQRAAFDNHKFVQEKVVTQLESLAGERGLLDFRTIMEKEYPAANYKVHSSNKSKSHWRKAVEIIRDTNVTDTIFGYPDHIQVLIKSNPKRLSQAILFVQKLRSEIEQQLYKFGDYGDDEVIPENPCISMVAYGKRIEFSDFPLQWRPLEFDTTENNGISFASVHAKGRSSQLSKEEIRFNKLLRFIAFACRKNDGKLVKLLRYKNDFVDFAYSGDEFVFTVRKSDNRGLNVGKLVEFVVFMISGNAKLDIAQVVENEL